MLHDSTSSSGAANPALAARLNQVQSEIKRLCQRYARPTDAVRLVAVAKQQGADKVLELVRAGQLDIAENYVQEGLAKIRTVSQSTPQFAASLSWHFIGSIQSRKCRTIAEHFDWVHSIASVKVATKLSQYRPADKPPLQVLIQVNLHAEPSKAGVCAAQLPELVAATVALPNLRLRGLMLLPKLENTLARQRVAFRRCRELLAQLNADLFAPDRLDQLSMGMSGDLEAAIAEGATMLRIGTALFGPRPPKPAPIQ